MPQPRIPRVISPFASATTTRSCGKVVHADAASMSISAEDTNALGSRENRLGSRTCSTRSPEPHFSYRGHDEGELNSALCLLKLRVARVIMISGSGIPGFRGGTSVYDPKETMKFRFNDGEMEIPEGWEDRSVIALSSPAGSKKPDASFAITKDPLASREPSLAAYADKQIVDMAKNCPRFELIHREQRNLDGLPAQQI